jgi:hypothetical protein
MKKLFFILVLLLSTLTSYAVWTRSVGSNAEFCVYRFDDEYFLILSFKDDDENRLTDNAVVKFKLNDGSIMRLQGTEGSRLTNTSSINWGFGISSGSTSDRHFSIFYITPEQIEKLKIGIDKVAINTVPEVYSRSEWRGKKKFSDELYNDFKNLKDEFDEEIAVKE